jgi:hypothetical protein
LKDEESQTSEGPNRKRLCSRGLLERSSEASIDLSTRRSQNCAPWPTFDHYGLEVSKPGANLCERLRCYDVAMQALLTPSCYAGFPAGTLVFDVGLISVD